jgi:hypothetical protein
MFAILQISDSNTIFRKPKIQSQRINLPSGDAFFIVTADKHLGKIPWKSLEKCLGILKHNILLPDDITVPEGINITKFIPDILPRLILMNSTTDYITKHRLHFQNKSLTIFDEKAIYQSYIEKLLPCFCSIRIITDLPEKYSSLSRRLLENYGFSLIISTEESFNSDVVISHSCKAPIYFEGTIFTNEGNCMMNGRVFSGSEIDLPCLYKNLKPRNVGDMLFASALYESCNEKSLGKLQYKSFGS